MKRVSLRVVFSLCWLCSLALPAVHAQTTKWPNKPVRLILGSDPGSGDDFVARTIAPKLSELLGQQFVVDNRSGAGGLRGQMLAQQALADGYTFLLAGGSMAGARYANMHAKYDVLRDFTPVSLLETSAFVMLVRPAIAKNLKEFVGLARSQPGKLRYGTTGAGQLPYWSAVLFNHMADIQAQEIPYKGTSEITIQVLNGNVDYFFAPFSIAVAVKGRLSALGVTTATRSSALPDVPTLAEAGLPGYDMPAWRSIMGPAGIRRDIVVSLNAAIARALAAPDVRERLRAAGSEPTPSTPEQLAKRYADWIGRFGKIAKQAGLKPQ
jgi:tripartite-type tricarboxylate transporter receptor subunit TctC